MERRKFIAGLGSLTAATAAGIGTGAVSMTQTTRQMDVGVADDADAYLSLDAADDSPYVTGSGESGSIAIQMDDDNVTSQGGEGVNPDSVSVFKKVFKIKNQSESKLTVTADVTGDHPDRVVFPYGDVENDSFSSLRGAGKDQPQISADILKSEGNGGLMKYNNGVVPEKPGAYGGSTPPKTFAVGGSAWVSIVVDTRGDEVSAGDNLVDSVTIFAEKAED